MQKFLLAAILLVAPSWMGFASDPQIVFTSDRDGSPKLYVMNADGSGVHRLGTLPGSYDNPEFSPDNKKIVFDYQEPQQYVNQQIHIINADGSGEEALTTPPGSSSHPKFTPEGRIVYGHAGSPTPPFIAHYIMDLDGSHSALYSINLPDSGDMDTVAFGQKGIIAFVHPFTVDEYEHAKQIYTTIVGGNDWTRLTSSRESVWLPAWSPGGSKIAYVNLGAISPSFGIPSYHEHDGIYVMNADGTSPTSVVRIDFSQDLGSTTGFVSIGPGRNTVQILSPPSFSPDGKMLTYAVNSGGKYQIYIVNVDGTGLKQLTAPTNDNRNPSFSR